MLGWFSAATARASRSKRARRSGSDRHRLGQHLQCNLAPELRVLGLPDHAHPALADLLDQAVVEQLLSGLDVHAHTPSRNGVRRSYA